MNAVYPILRVKNLKKEYSMGLKSTFKVLQGVSFIATLGEIIILMGPSGSGKSTLINLLTGLEEPTEGSIEVKNQNIFGLHDNMRTELRRDNLGIIFQFFELHNGLTCRETLELKLLINKTDCNNESERIFRLLEEVGLQEKIDIFVDQLSRGEKQRLAIARALVSDPHIIFADEPTGALDFETATEIMALLRIIVKKKNRLLIISTHDYNILQDGDRVLVLEDGKILKDLPSISREDFLQSNGIEEYTLEV